LSTQLDLKIFFKKCDFSLDFVCAKCYIYLSMNEELNINRKEREMKGYRFYEKDFKAKNWKFSHIDGNKGCMVYYSECEELINGRWEGFVAIKNIPFVRQRSIYPINMN